MQYETSYIHMKFTIKIASSGRLLDGRAAIVFSSQPAEIGKIGGRPSVFGTDEEAVKTPARQKGSYMGQPSVSLPTSFHPTTLTHRKSNVPSAPYTVTSESVSEQDRSTCRQAFAALAVCASGEQSPTSTTSKGHCGPNLQNSPGQQTNGDITTNRDSATEYKHGETAQTVKQPTVQELRQNNKQTRK